MNSVRKMSVIAVFAAISFLLMFFLEFPLPFFPVFLKYDPSDVIALIISFKFDPWSGGLVVFLRNIIFLLTGKAPLIGVVLNLVASGSFVITAGVIYSLRKTLKTALLALLSATLVMALIMIPVNYYVLTKFYTSFKPMFYLFVIFNLIKGILNGILTFFLYKKVSSFLKLDKKKSISKRNSLSAQNGKMTPQELEGKKIELFHKLAEIVHNDPELKLPKGVREKWEEAYSNEKKMNQYEQVIKGKKGEKNE